MHGYLVSDALHRMTDAELDLDGPSAVWPPSMLADARARAVARPADPDPVALVSVARRSAGRRLRRRARSRRRSSPTGCTLHCSSAFETVPARFLAVRFQGVDAVGHYFLRYAEPRPSATSRDDERRRLGRVLEQYYGFLDGQIGRRSTRSAPTICCSWSRRSGWSRSAPASACSSAWSGNADVSGTHERAPDGFLLAYGTPVRAGGRRRAPSLDVAPTVLYFFGLADRPRHGRLRAHRPLPRAFTAERPVTFIPTYGR